MKFLQDQIQFLKTGTLLTEMYELLQEGVCVCACVRACVRVWWVNTTSRWSQRFPEGHDSTEDNNQNSTKWPSWRTTVGIIAKDWVPFGSSVTGGSCANFLRSKLRPTAAVAAGVLILHNSTAPCRARNIRSVCTNWEQEALPHPSYESSWFLPLPKAETVHVAVSWRIRQRNSSGQLYGIINYQSVGKLWWGVRVFNVSCLIKRNILKLNRYCALLLGHSM